MARTQSFLDLWLYNVSNLSTSLRIKNRAYIQVHGIGSCQSNLRSRQTSSIPSCCFLGFPCPSWIASSGGALWVVEGRGRQESHTLLANTEIFGDIQAMVTNRLKCLIIKAKQPGFSTKQMRTCKVGPTVGWEKGSWTGKKGFKHWTGKKNLNEFCALKTFGKILAMFLG